MKKNIFLLTFCFWTTTTLGQAVLVKNIPLIKESYKIDSIVTNFKNSFKEELAKHDSCFFLTLDVQRINSKSYNLSIELLKCHIGYILLKKDNDLLLRPNIRYFTFENRFVFVTGSSADIKELFTMSLLKKRFKFLQKTHSEKLTPDDIISITYKFYNSQFQPTYIDAY